MISSVTNKVNFTSQPNNNVKEQRKQTQEQVATGVGAAGAAGAATKYAAQKGIKAEAAETFFGQLSGKVSGGVKAANNSKEAVSGLWGTFKSNIKVYTANILEHLDKLKNTKFIGSIVKSPITRKLSAVAGGALAFFVLVTGVNKACKNGEIAVEDIKKQFEDFKNAA